MPQNAPPDVPAFVPQGLDPEPTKDQPSQSGAKEPERVASAVELMQRSRRAVRMQRNQRRKQASELKSKAIEMTQARQNDFRLRVRMEALALLSGVGMGCAFPLFWYGYEKIAVSVLAPSVVAALLSLLFLATKPPTFEHQVKPSKRSNRIR